MKLLNLKLKKLIYWKYSGNFPSPFKSEGTEIEEFRQYQTWDDANLINWKISAKNNEFFINLFRQEKDASLHFFFDINYNWKWWNKKSAKKNIYDTILKILIWSQKNWVSIKWSLNDIKEKKIKHYNLKNNIKNWHRLIKNIEKNIKKISKKKHISYIQDFVKYKLWSSKKEIIIIFSDFSSFEEEQYKKLLKLNQKKEIILAQIPIVYFSWINFNRYTINSENIKKNKKLLKKFSIIDLS